MLKGLTRTRTLVDVSGSVDDIEKAFHVTMSIYPHPKEARTFFAPDVEPSLDLDTPVLAISGLDNYVKPHPQVRILGGGGSTGGGAGVGSAPGGGYWGYDFQTAYLPNNVSLNGEGQSVALFELTGYDPIDITNYLSGTGLPGVPIQNVLIDGFDGNDTNVDYAVECTGDIEMALSIAPGLSTIYVYEGPTPMDVAPLETNYVQPSATTAQINDVIQSNRDRRPGQPNKLLVRNGHQFKHGADFPAVRRPRSELLPRQWRLRGFFQEQLINQPTILT